MGARELAEYARSDNPLEISLGVAALNSLLDVDPRELAEGNAADLLSAAGRDTHLAVVGHFPFVEGLRDRFARLSVFELEPEEGDYPARRRPR